MYMALVENRRGMLDSVIRGTKFTGLPAWAQKQVAALLAAQPDSEDTAHSMFCWAGRVDVFLEKLGSKKKSRQATPVMDQVFPCPERSALG